MKTQQTEQEFMLSKDAIKFDVDDYTAIYHRMLGGLTLLDKKSEKILAGFKNGKLVDSSLLERDAENRTEELIQQLILRNLIESPHESSPSIQSNKPNNQVSIIQLVMANACNFGCTYCFEGVQGQELSADEDLKKIDASRIRAPEEIKIDINDSMYASEERLTQQYDPKNRRMKPGDGVRYVETSLEVAKSTGVQEVMIQFFGGEPLLNWKTIKAVLNEFGHEFDGIKIQYSTVTNGSLITDEVSRVFSEYEVAVCVSVDSPNSPSRPLKDGGDSMPIVMEGLRMLQKYNNRVAINSALTTSTWDDFNNSIVDLAVEVGSHEIGVVVDFDPTFYASYGTDNIVEKLWGVIEYGREQGVVLTGYWHQIFQVMLGFNTIEHRGFKNCSAKGAQFSIEPNGSVFSCKAGSTIIGNIQDGKKLLDTDGYKSHSELRTNNPEFCKGCDIEGFCAGLCLGSLEKKFGSLDSVEKGACDFYRKITKKHIESVKPYEIATLEI